IWGRNDYAQTNVPPAASNVVAVATGGYHHLALKADGTLLAWGADYAGQIDIPGGLNGIMAVAAGAAHSLALKTDGTVTAWGYNAYGQATVPAGLGNVVAIAGGWQHSLALKRDGTVVAWGNPSGGGPGSVVPAGLNNVTAIAASYHQNLALKSDGTVVAWGSDPGLTNIPPGLGNVIAVAAAYDANLALKSDGSLVAWGYGVTTTNLPAGLSNVVAIAGGYYNFTALKSDGTVVIWGDNSYAQTNVPPGLTNVAVIATGSGDCLTLASSDAPQIVQPPLGMTTLAESPALFVANAFGAPPLVYQWKFNGTNLDGMTGATLLLTNLQLAQSGLYSVVASNALNSVESPAAALAVLPFIATVQPTNQLLYLGDTLNVTFQGPVPRFFQWLFRGVPLADETNATLVLNNTVTNQPGAYAVVVSNAYGMATNIPALLIVTNRAPFITSQPTNIVASPGGTVTFQANANGNKPLTYQWVLNGVDIPGATNATLVLSNVWLNQAGSYSIRVSNGAGSFTSSNAALSVLNVVIWGQTNNFGLNIVPSDLTNAVAVAVGNSHAVALKSNGQIDVWGSNLSGQTSLPANLTNVVAIAAAWNHSLALKADGTVVSWGDLTTVPSNVTNVIAIAAGDYHSQALKADGTVVAWGSGSGTTVPAGLTNVTAITAGGTFGAALKTDKSVVGWGVSPTYTTGMTNVVAIAACEFPLIALKADGTVVAAGTTASPANLTNAVAVAAGRYDAVALKSNGTLTNWMSPSTTPAGLTNVSSFANGQYIGLAIIGNGPQPSNVPFAGLNRISTSFTVSLPAQYGHLYRLEYKNSVTDANWKTLPLNLGVSNSIILTDPAATNATRFYHVRQW
ncbi:MAG: immunoglobulin domain-containing protein, partial [Verrucomicrobia bacterium]|nr:immunoglobulin domain-containing protein [Verrucomicrobiota bacterium]